MFNVVLLYDYNGIYNRSYRYLRSTTDRFHCEMDGGCRVRM